MWLCLSGCKSDPATPEHWDKRIADAKGKKEKLRAVEDLRGSKYLTAAMLPMLHKRLESEKSAEVRASIVRVLGEQKNPSSVEVLAGVIDPAPSDSETKALNKEIANALGNLGDLKAVPTLLKLMKTKDDYTVISSIESLGDLKAKDAFDALNELANDDTIPPFVTKKAIEALGNVGDPRAVPALVKGMYKERKGISFYREASFSLYQIGKPAADALVPVVEGKDKALASWAESANMKDFVLAAKAMQVLGDLHELRAEKAVAGFLNYKSEFDEIRLIMRMRAADAAGRMRSKEAVKVLAGLLDENEANARKEYVWALSRIGSKDAVGKLVETAGKGPWGAREESIRGVAMLGDDPAVFDKFAGAEEKLFTAECKEDDGYRECSDVAAAVKKHVEKIHEYGLRAGAAKECKGDAVCWSKKLDDKSEGVRERAAYEVGRSGNAALVGELMRRLREKNLDTRLAFIQGADWLVFDSKDALTEAKKGLADLKQQLVDEKGKTEFDKVNEDLRRLAVAVDR